MTASPRSPYQAGSRPVANSLNVAFRWLLIASALVFALASSAALALPFPTSSQFALAISWAVALSFLVGAAALLGVGITEILRGSSLTERKASRWRVKPAPGVRLPLAFSGLGLVLTIYYGLHVFWWNPFLAPSVLSIYGIFIPGKSTTRVETNLKIL